MQKEISNQISTLPIRKNVRGKHHKVNCPVCFSRNVTSGTKFLDKKRKYHENLMQIFSFTCNFCPTSEIFYTCADSKNNLWYLNQNQEVIRGVDPTFEHSHLCKCGGKIKKDIRESDGMSSVGKYRVSTEPIKNWRIFLSCTNCLFETEVFDKSLLPSFEFASSCRRQKMIPKYVEENYVFE